MRWQSTLSRKDILAEAFRPLHESGVVTSPVAVTMLRALGLIARDVRARGADPERLRLLENEARRVLASLSDGDGAWGPTEDPRRVAAEEGLVSDRHTAAADGARGQAGGVTAG